MITRKDVEEARRMIADNIVHTPLVPSHRVSDICGAEIFFKLENLQRTGSFKERGALNRLLRLTEEEKAKGVVVASAGNHAQGVAYHSKRLGIKSSIVMPVGTPLIKVVSTQRYGAKVILHGDNYDEANTLAKKMSEEESLILVHPFEDPFVMAGQGTIAAEILDEKAVADLDTVVCPIGGGGLISGIATYIKETRPDVRVIGVEAASCAGMKASISQGRPVALSAASSLADGIAVKQIGAENYEIVRKYVDEVIAVDEDSIAAAVLALLEMEKVVAEGAGAVPVAALINQAGKLQGRKIVAIISGGNIDVNILNKIITRGLTAEGRIVEVQIRLADVPGALVSALELIKKLRANILEVSHHRYDARTPFGKVDISITLETKGHEHLEEVRGALEKAGYLI